VSDYQGGRFDDDATLLLVEWRTGEEQDLNPRPEVETGRA
jgi:hypothetical protein